MKVNERAYLYKKENGDICFSDEIRLKFSFFEKIRILFGLKIGFILKKDIKGESNFTLSKELSEGLVQDFKYPMDIRLYKIVLDIETLMLSVILFYEYSKNSHISTLPFIMLICIILAYIGYYIEKYTKHETGL